MDKGFARIEESSHRKSDSATKSLGSLIQINSISIDIGNAMEEIEVPTVHEHFSIRGFVAGMRKKNLKKCLPFDSEGGADDFSQILPPLRVPSFRWWQCVDCVPDILSESVVKAVATGRDDMGTSSCQHVEGEKDSLYLLENTGKERGWRANVDQEDVAPVNTITNSKACSTDGRKAILCGKDKPGAADPDSDTADNQLQIQDRENTSADVCVESPVAEPPSRRVEEPENASSGSDGALSTLPHRRKPKLRSLADIMVEDRNPASENLRLKSASSSGVQARSTEEVGVGPRFQPDVPVDDARGPRSTHTKRKSVPEENKGTSGTTYPSGAAKKLKGPTLEAERSFKRVDILESDSERDLSARMDSRNVAKTHLNKPKKGKIISVSKKMRQAPFNGIVAIRESPKTNLSCSSNLHKQAVSGETSFHKSGNAPSNKEEMRPYFKGLLSGQQTERISTLAKSTRPEFEACYNPLVPPSKNVSGDRNVKGKVALDLSLNSYSDAEENSGNQSSSGQDRGIPDLNETFSQKEDTTSGKQLPTFPENRFLPLQRNTDVSGFSSKERAREGKMPFGFPEWQTVQKVNNNTEHGRSGGASEDIPMDIVELLAKNQLERELGRSWTHLQSNGIDDSIRRSPAVQVDRRPEMIGFPLVNRRNGVNTANGNLGVHQNVPLHSARLNMYSPGMGKFEESQFNLFGSFTQSQQRKTQYSASSSFTTGPRPSVATELVWPPRRESVPFQFNVPQNRNSSIQASNMGGPSYTGGPSFSDKYHKGKTISDIKGREEKRTVPDPSLLKEGRIGSNSSSAGSLDPYSNDTIPAMQLLSLMDRGMVSGTSYKVGPKSFLDKTLSPCNHHRRTNENENQNFLSGSFLSQTSHSTYFPQLRYGASSSGEKNSPSYLPGQLPVEQRNSKAVHVEGANNLVTRPVRSCSPLGVCTLNRNPADFSIPDSKNEYTISAKDLKPRKRKALKEKPRSMNMVGQKKQRVRKEHSQK